MTGVAWCLLENIHAITRLSHRHPTLVDPPWIPAWPFFPSDTAAGIQGLLQANLAWGLLVNVHARLLWGRYSHSPPSSQHQARWLLLPVPLQPPVLSPSLTSLTPGSPSRWVMGLTLFILSPMAGDFKTPTNCSSLHRDPTCSISVTDQACLLSLPPHCVQFSCLVRFVSLFVCLHPFPYHPTKQSPWSNTLKGEDSLSFHILLQQT